MNIFQQKYILSKIITNFISFETLFANKMRILKQKRRSDSFSNVGFFFQLNLFTVLHVISDWALIFFFCAQHYDILCSIYNRKQLLKTELRFCVRLYATGSNFQVRKPWIRAITESIIHQFFIILNKDSFGLIMNIFLQKWIYR